MFGWHLRLIVSGTAVGNLTAVSATAVSLSQWEISESKLLLELTGLVGSPSGPSPTLQGSRLCSVAVIPFSGGSWVISEALHTGML